MSQGQDLWGTVKDSSGALVSGATVEAEKSGASTVAASSTTNSDGQWTLVLPTTGTYNLTATKSGESGLIVHVEGGADQDSISVGIGSTQTV